MTFPVFTDEIAFASDPFDDPQVWTTIDAVDVKQRGYTRGRQTQSDDTQPGRSSLVLDDSNRTYEPGNAAGPYFPNVKVMRRVRSKGTINATTYYLFTTFIHVEDGWQREESEPGHCEVGVPGIDAFEVLQSNILTAADTFPEQRSGERIAAILDAVGFPAGERAIDTGQTVVQALAAGDAETNALSLILDAAKTEQGYFFIDARGYAVFHDRHKRLMPPYTEVQATFADAANADAGRLLYKRVSVRRSRILNDIRITPRGLSQQTAEDAASIGENLRRTDASSSIHASADDARHACQFRLSQTKDSFERFEQLEIEPGVDADLWEAVLSLGIGDRIRVIHTPEGGGVPLTQDCHIESIDLSVGPATAARCVWRLAPADQTQYWIAGLAGFSEAGVTTKAVY